MPMISSVTRVFRGGSAAIRTGEHEPRLVMVGMELGRDAGAILVETHADGRSRLAFGSGEEFVGYRRALPANVDAAARRLLEAAAPFVGLLPRADPDAARGWGMVRIKLRTPDVEYAEESRVSELETRRSRLAPLWYAHSELLRRMIVVLFRTPSAAAEAGETSPGLSRARSLWGGWRQAADERIA